MIKRYMDLQKELQKLERKLDFVYVQKRDKTIQIQRDIQKIQEKFLWDFGFVMVDKNATLGDDYPALKFAAPESMEPSIVHNIRCKMNLIERMIIRGEFESLDIFMHDFIPEI